MGLFSLFSNKSSSSSSNATTTNNYDQRRVESSSAGDGALIASGGSYLTVNSMDQGALEVAGGAVKDSLGLAKQIATTLGASVGQFSAGATGSIDGLAHLVDKQQTAATDQVMGSQFATMMALGVVGLVAVMALRKAR